MQAEPEVSGVDLATALALPLSRQYTVDSVRVLSHVFQSCDGLRRLPPFGDGDNTFAVSKYILKLFVVFGELLDLSVFPFRKAYLNASEVPLPRLLLVGTEPGYLIER